MFKFLGRIVRFLWKTLSWVRIAVLNLLFIALLVIIFQSLKHAPEIQVPKQSALFVAPSGVLVDQQTYQPTVLDLLSDPQDRPQETNIHDLIKAIRYARDDREITGLVIRLDFLASAGISKIEEIGQAINYFKQSGKKVVAFADSMNQQQYLLASFADEIYINDMGSIYLTGFGVYRNYYKSAADKLALKFHVFRVGEYKDAIEPFIRDNMSTASKEHIGTWINNLWSGYTRTIEAHRELEAGSIDRLIADLDKDLDLVDGNAAKYAVDKKLVDAAMSRVQLKEQLIEYFGENDDENINAIGVSAYLNNPMANHEKQSENKIGLIVATGNILDGHQPESAIGSESLSALIRKAREDDELSALVVRVDSGGGSAFASEVIRDQLKVTKESGLPVYISMGSVAASGGYWISTPATEIWSTPTTLTGSIGVFGLIPNISESLSKLGIYSDGVGTSDLSDSFNIDRELSPRAKVIIQSSVENIYSRFLELVAESRESSVDKIHQIAQGRVWSGSTAKELGLIDNLGSLYDVIDYAASEAGFANYNVKKISKDISPRDQLIRTLIEQSSGYLPKIIDNHSTLLNHNFLNTTNLGRDSQFLIQNSSNSDNQVQVFARCLECAAP